VFADQSIPEDIIFFLGYSLDCPILHSVRYVCVDTICLP
jgi:hypothetical protein